MKREKAIVLLSGGLDSATCLYKAKGQGYEPVALSFDYGQRHKAELQAAKRIATHLGIEHQVVAVDLRKIGGSALTSDIAVPKGGEHLKAEGLIPVTYVPVRNLIFLSLAYALSEAVRAAAIYIGVNAIDYSGYPDCRPDFIESFSRTAALASKAGREGHGADIVTPLISLSKAEIAAEAIRLGVPVELTWSCYDPQASGTNLLPCRNCDACILRRDGFMAAGLALSTEAIYGSPIERL
jgi:7-cyano-7-deazaguanine synthase